MSEKVKVIKKPKSQLDKNTTFDYINIVLMLVILFVTLYPVWYVLCLSLSSAEWINSGAVNFWPKGINIDAYIKVLNDAAVPRSYGNSILYTVVGTVVNLVMTVGFAYPLSRKTFVLRSVIMKLVVVTMFFSGGLIPTYLVVRGFGLLNSMWSLIIPNLIWTFDLIIIKNFFEGIPHELYEAAIIDGASEFTIMTKIFVPLAKPAIASVALFFAMGHWNSYLIPSIYITDKAKMPLQVVLKEMLVNMSGTNPDTEAFSTITPESFKNATIFISILPFLILYPYLQKFFIKGLTIGAVKG